MKTIIVGGVAGGMSCATRLRRLDETRNIIVIEKGNYVSFANCGLPYYIGEEIKQRNQLLVKTPQQLNARFVLDIRTNQEVVAIHPENKTITIKTDSKTYDESYDELVLSPGAKPFVPPVNGIQDARNLYHVRSIPDVDKIIEQLQTQAITSITILGAGFIGLEMAENLHKRGYKIHIVDMMDHVLANADSEMASFLHQELIKQGVSIHLNKQLIALKEQGKQLVFSDNSILTSDVIISSIGVQADTNFLKNSGIALNTKGSILIDENYETNKKDIYAIGDAASANHFLTKKPTMIALASPANRQGRQVADVIMKLRKKANKGNLGTAIVRVFDLTFAYTGLNEMQLRLSNTPYAVVHIQSKDHAGYYPNSSNIDLKLLFDRFSGLIYGAQAVGKKGVDKRIDVIATAIKAHLNVYDLQELELSYAPPFGLAKDPVNMVGYAASNIIDGISNNVQWYNLDETKIQEVQLLDVREPSEWKNGVIKGATCIPLDTLRENLDTLDKKKETIVYCHSGLRSYLAERILQQNGFIVKNLDGAFHIYAMMYPENIVR